MVTIGRPLRVLRLLGVLEPGGAQLSVLRLARAQEELGVRSTVAAGDATPAGVALARTHGYEPLVFTTREHVTVASHQWRLDPELAGWLAPLLSGYDLAHGHMLGAWWALATAAPPALPVVASEHNALTWPLGDETAAAARAAPRLALFYAHGPACAAFAAGLGIGPDRLRTGRSAVPPTGAPLPGLRAPRVTFTGRLREDKGPDVLLRALALMADPPATYVVGDGPLRPALERLVGDLGLREVVRLTGWSDRPDGYVAGAAAQVVPSREDAWPQSALVALALGVPVVASAVEGLPRLLAGRRGLLVPPEDPPALAAALRTVLTGEHGLDLAAGRRLAARHDTQAVAAAYLADYRAVLGRERPAVRVASRTEDGSDTEPATEG